MTSSFVQSIGTADDAIAYAIAMKDASDGLMFLAAWKSHDRPYILWRWPDYLQRIEKEALNVETRTGDDD